MHLNDFLASLSLGTMLIAVIVIAAVLLLFLRHRANRHPLEGREERNVGADIDAGVTAEDRSRPR